MYYLRTIEKGTGDYIERARTYCVNRAFAKAEILSKVYGHIIMTSPTGGTLGWMNGRTV